NTSASAMADITARSLTITATGANKVYDGTISATVTLSDDRLAGDSLTTSYASASFANKTVGTAKTVTVSGIALSGADAGNHPCNPPAGPTANIPAATVTGSVTATNKGYDGTTVATIAARTLSGLLGSDTVSLTGGIASFASKTVG